MRLQYDMIIAAIDSTDTMDARPVVAETPHWPAIAIGLACGAAALWAPRRRWP
jgi:carbon starvation protein CstA